MRKTYTKFYRKEETAIAMMQMKNKSCERANNYNDIFAVVDGPDNNFAVVDIKTAIELNLGYMIKY